ncbi:MAG: hypothetical protein HZB99_00375 [Candidatus Harrisonbacteria bacterium]|nr:hypothetical protein [Candidatus Harrisonbacteria bacterium]
MNSKYRLKEGSGNFYRKATVIVPDEASAEKWNKALRKDLPKEVVIPK